MTTIDQTRGSLRSASGRLAQASLAADLPFLLARTSTASIKNANTALAQVGLRVRSFCVLWLACEGLRVSQRELSEFLDLDPSQIVLLVDELERRGAVTRRPDPRDRRSRIVEATPVGRRLLRAALRAVESANARSFGALTAPERQMLLHLMSRVAIDSA